MNEKFNNEKFRFSAVLYPLYKSERSDVRESVRIVPMRLRFYGVTTLRGAMGKGAKDLQR